MTNKGSSIFKYGFLSVAAFVSVFPFLFMLLGVTNKSIDISTGNLKIGQEFLTNLSNLLSNDLNFQRAFLNSLLVSLITTICALTISSIAGYGFEIYRSKKSDKLFNFILLSMMVPFASLMIPLYRMFGQLNKIGLSNFGLNSYFSVIIPAVSTAFLIFFFRQNAKAFPKELVEAARIDGLSEIGIFFKIFMPAAKNTYAAGAIITFMSSWNNYLWPLVALQSPEKRTLPLVLSAMGASYTPDYGMMMVGIVISTLPTAIIFFVMQKQFVQGMLGSIK
ncbi:carbohydrate ABC transporter permease [Carnobacterium maltaromaticum]|uniref:Carbohydrate ABC transporter permease n=1 Tax=Carnobacterium maltaromaticum TaxID=2751 RepID=A0AAW9K1W0_CARML|nr:carbohydrate ABC transporter permease [Carnobacterium maltaromaticum]MDZ5757412.1 carbohydrate ABC transporter permease [Carnobacterium maltaromaticum]